MSGSRVGGHVTGLRLRVRHNSSAFVVDLDSEASVGLLKVVIEEKTGMSARDQSILCGYPPKPLLEPDGKLLIECNIRDNDQITLTNKSSHGIKQGFSSEPYIPPMNDRSIVVCREVPGDNSCLFHAAAYVLEGRQRTSGPCMPIRIKIAEVVAAHPQKFTTDYLGMPNTEYCSRIRDPGFWGGAIELSILSFLFSVEVIVFDLTTGSTPLCYGVNEGYTRFSMLMYTGNHYDALAMTALYGSPESNDKVIFGVSDKSKAMAKVLDFLVSERKRRMGH
ncbi:ubiquitin thioesterase OTU1 [Pelomyxa schiedti]|nr:ubiquitin thioesterase OTU1 [Pelomyxa schiedti]